MFVICAMSVISFVLVSSTSEQYEAFETWKSKFLISYTNSKTELEAFKQFSINQKLIDDHNKLYEACDSSFSLGLWDKSDKSASEINGQLNGLQMTVASKAIYISGFEINTANVSYLNYAEQNYVTRVLDQGCCSRFRSFAYAD